MLATWGCTTFPKPTLSLDFLGATSLDSGITFSRGSQATLFDSTGTLVYAKHNLALQSEDLSTTWTTTGATVSANATTSPLGTTTADKLQEDTSTGSHLVSQNITFIAASHTASVFAKKAERDFVRVLMFDGTNTFSGFFNLSNGTIGTLTGTGTTATIADFGNGWYRCAITATTAAGSGTFAPRIALANNNSSYTGVAGNGIFMWGAQLNLTAMEGGVTSSLSTYYPTVASAYYAPRFDYNPSTLQPRGLLIEEQRTNSIRNNTMQGAVAGTPGTMPTNWSTFTTRTGLTREIVGTGTENGITYIDIRISGTPNTSGNYSVLFETNTGVSAANAQNWAQSVYLKLQSGSFSGISSVVQNQDERSTTTYIRTNSSAPITITSQALSTQRFVFSSTLSGGATVAHLLPYLALTLDGAAIDITLRIGLPQLELGAFATSVIPTTTTALTRNADVATMTGTNFSSWYNQTEGTLVGQFFVPPNLAAFPSTTGALSDGTTNNQISLYAFTSGLFTNVKTLNVTQGDPGVLATPIVGALAKFAVGIGTNNTVSVWNGTAGAIDTSVTVPTVNQFIIGANVAGSSRINSCIQRIAYYPVRLQASQLQALTA